MKNDIKSGKKFSICVYCGSRHGASPLYTQAAREVGQWLGRHGYRLVYGGGNAGLMGEVANATLCAGGEVYGVIPQRLMDIEQGHLGITELVVVQTMHQRKQAMAEASDAFLALPGGIGTFEELFEAWSWRQLAYHDNPIGLLNIHGYYDKLLGFIETSIQQGFMDEKQVSYLTIANNVTQMMEQLAHLLSQPSQPDSFDAI